MFETSVKPSSTCSLLETVKNVSYLNAVCKSSPGKLQQFSRSMSKREKVLNSIKSSQTDSDTYQTAQNKNRGFRNKTVLRFQNNNNELDLT